MRQPARFEMRLVAVATLLVLTSALACGCVGGSRSSPGVAPDSIVLKTVDVQPGSVHIVGDTISSALRFESYESTIESGDLVVALHYTLGDTKTNLGAFDLDIPTPGTTVSGVVLSGGGTRKRIR